AAEGLCNGIAADNLARTVEHRILREVEARKLAVDGAERIRRARQRHVVDLDAGVALTMLEVAVPAPGLAEQAEGAVTTHRVAAHGAHQEHQLVGRNVGPLRTVGEGGGGGSRRTRHAANGSTATGRESRRA